MEVGEVKDRLDDALCATRLRPSHLVSVHACHDVICILRCSSFGGHCARRRISAALLPTP